MKDALFISGLIAGILLMALLMERGKGIREIDPEDEDYYDRWGDGDAARN